MTTLAETGPVSGSILRRGEARLFLLIAPVLYLAYALLTPPFQTPDEHQHLFRAWQLSQLQLFGQRRGVGSGGVLPASLGRAALPEIGSLEPHILKRPIVQRSPAQFLRSGTPLQTGAPTRFYDFRSTVIYSPAGYLPQVGAICFGKAVDLSVENIVRLGRVLNATIAIFLIYWSLRLTPVGALAILFVGLLPMTAAASAAFGQDGLVIGGASVLTAAGLRVALGHHQGRGNLMAVGAVAVLVTLSKVFYLPLAMIAGQPFVCDRVQARRLWRPLAICVIAAALTVSWLYANSSGVVPPWPGIPPVGERLTSWLYHPMEFPVVLQRTYIAHGPDLFTSLFTFGWLNIPAVSAALLTLLAFGLLFLAGDPEPARLGWHIRLWLVGWVLITLLLLSLVAWLYWTPEPMGRIVGLQGRYFIPIAPALLIAMLRSQRAATQFSELVPLLLVGANICTLATIVRAFYIF